ncbi:hypothetical protein BST81_25755 [Leptolyngbya sp. 'hensonii']|uniref:HHL1-like protein n=1 Tax=Leptolyngbya sp. 'hensonii' TaxID=1922337 RepID=UPI00094F868C|nr:HHL1-like protein [Leptolyngbya sp. 'hensonii']OLP15557.1 hypothetical protein BST81_25755 [Leptolyngbya sp. 'hensonii']
MTTSSGFGKTKSQPKVSQRAIERAEAGKKFDQMKAEGLPEFEIYIRIQGKKNWYPVGVVAVKRSAQINQAIFDSQKDLLQGAFRLFPSLRKHQQQLEYGYRLKEFKDEPIQIAEPPKTAATGALQSVLTGVKDRISFLLQRP